MLSYREQSFIHCIIAVLCSPLFEVCMHMAFWKSFTFPHWCGLVVSDSPLFLLRVLLLLIDIRQASTGAISSAKGFIYIFKTYAHCSCSHILRIELGLELDDPQGPFQPRRLNGYGNTSVLVGKMQRLAGTGWKENKHICVGALRFLYKHKWPIKLHHCTMKCNDPYSFSSVCSVLFVYLLLTMIWNYLWPLV